MKVTVFSDFIGLEALSKYCIVDIIGTSIISEGSSDEVKQIARTNIKIFFNKDNIDDRSQAYLLMNILENEKIALFVTDQLYSTHKDSNGKAYHVALPKDRIIMKLL
jgi:hypothetical protein